MKTYAEIVGDRNDLHRMVWVLWVAVIMLGLVIQRQAEYMHKESDYRLEVDRLTIALHKQQAESVHKIVDVLCLTEKHERMKVGLPVTDPVWQTCP